MPCLTPWPWSTAVGVAFAGYAVHVTVQRPYRSHYTAEPLPSRDAAGRRQALSAACRRLGVGSSCAAIALPEARVFRRALDLPTVRRRHRWAVARLHVRRALPTPASEWAFRLTHKAPTSAQLLAAQQRDIAHASALLRSANLRPSAVLASRDALRIGAASTTDGSLGPDTPGARLSAALACAARRPGPANLLGAESTTPSTSAVQQRTLFGGAVAVTLLAIAATLHLVPQAGNAPSAAAPTSSRHGAESSAPPAPPPPLENKKDHGRDPAVSPAPPAAETYRPPDAEDRKWQLATWLDALAAARPTGLYLTEIRFGDEIAVRAQADSLHRVDAYLDALSAHDRFAPRLTSIDHREGEAIEFQLAARPTNVATGARDTSLRPLRDYRSENELRDGGSVHLQRQDLQGRSAGLVMQLERHQLIVKALQQRAGSDGATAVLRLRIAGEYPQIRAWFAELATERLSQGVAHARLRRSEGRSLQLEIELLLAAEGGNE